MSDSSLIEIVILAAVAAFFIFKLRSVLGKRTGHEEKPDFDPFKPRPNDAEGEDDKVVQLPERGKGPRISQDELFEQGEPESAEAAMDDSPLAAGITQIRLADRDFDPVQFVGGARGAFEMIVAAFADGDSKSLRPLLANDVFSDFDGAIKDRESRNESLETTLIGITSVDLIEAEMQQKSAFVTVKFVSEQVNVTRDSEGRIVDGDPNEVTKITDIWTFARNTRSRDPNWALVATRSPN
ncbi:Tim44 domain-containing protein [Pelagibius litoralis]|uniref:Tim44 domain-containing protein n=1 Tax=Pelagibius litoralis TaxID=374515 RepID=A0A967F208_9PROT|nr:Tim44/TimA family putative adaptor protein [Pelagibius litoralis]NIA71718.1 Tim44 domain-containing protein [Pelagibius litoralis]